MREANVYVRHRRCGLPYDQGTFIAYLPHMPTTTTKITWRHDFDQAVADAKAQRKLVLLDFTAAPM